MPLKIKPDLKMFLSLFFLYYSSLYPTFHPWGCNMTIPRTDIFWYNGRYGQVSDKRLRRYFSMYSGFTSSLRNKFHRILLNVSQLEAPVCEYLRRFIWNIMRSHMHLFYIYTRQYFNGRAPNRVYELTTPHPTPWLLGCPAISHHCLSWFFGST